MTLLAARRRGPALAALALGSVVAACSRGAAPAVGSGPERPVPATRAERTNYRETSSHADVVAFLDTIEGGNRPVVVGSIGRSVEGRDIPYVVMARPLVRTAAQARASGKPVVYVQANIHGGEVEGKEALLALVRDLAHAPRPSVVDSIVLIAVPIYNADGNERLGPQERQREAQNGPALVGQRANAAGLDLNRDYVKAEAPETRASLAMFRAWDPDVFVDLHTTNGSYHGYALTYSPSLSPAAPLGAYTRAMLAELRARMRTREGLETFDYGNFNDGGPEASTDSVHAGWYTYDARPRFGTNYYGLRNRIAILSEAYSHDPFERRVKATYAFTRQLLSLVAEQRRELRLRQQQAEAPLISRAPVTVALRSVLPSAAPAQPVRYELLTRTGDSSRTEAGVPRGIRRTGQFVTRTMPVFDRFVPALTVPLPGAYLVPATDTATVSRLRAHGIRVERTGGELDANVSFEGFVVDSIVRAPRPFQGHTEVRLVGRWRAASVPVTAQAPFLVDLHQPLALLAAYLLDPQSEDGLTTWNLFDDALAVGRAHPVLRFPTR